MELGANEDFLHLGRAGPPLILESPSPTAQDVQSCSNVPDGLPIDNSFEEAFDQRFGDDGVAGPAVDRCAYRDTASIISATPHQTLPSSAQPQRPHADELLSRYAWEDRCSCTNAIQPHPSTQNALLGFPCGFCDQGSVLGLPCPFCGYGATEQDVSANGSTMDTDLEQRRRWNIANGHEEVCGIPDELQHPLRNAPSNQPQHTNAITEDLAAMTRQMLAGVLFAQALAPALMLLLGSNSTCDRPQQSQNQSVRHIRPYNPDEADVPRSELKQPQAHAPGRTRQRKVPSKDTQPEETPQLTAGAQSAAASGASDAQATTNNNNERSTITQVTGVSLEQLLLSVDPVAKNPRAGDYVVHDDDSDEDAFDNRPADDGPVADAATNGNSIDNAIDVEDDEDADFTPRPQIGHSKSLHPARRYEYGVSQQMPATTRGFEPTRAFDPPTHNSKANVLRDDHSCRNLCGEPDNDEMIACDNEAHHGETHWWHYSCVPYQNASELPQGTAEWYCPTCLEADLRPPNYPKTPKPEELEQNRRPNGVSYSKAELADQKLFPNPLPTPNFYGTPNQNGNGWTEIEQRACIFQMRRLSPRWKAAQGFLFPSVSVEMLRMQGVDKSAAAIKNWWSRNGRARCNYDERTRHKAGQEDVMRTSMQSSGKTQADAMGKMPSEDKIPGDTDGSSEAGPAKLVSGPAKTQKRRKANRATASTSRDGPRELPMSSIERLPKTLGELPGPSKMVRKRRLSDDEDEDEVQSSGQKPVKRQRKSREQRCDDQLQAALKNSLLDP